MLLDTTTCYRALCSRDARFDGRFFVGVSSTGIYCRPVCRVRTPKAENCTFYPSAAAAEQAGYRPCLRCRPELAPGCASVDATRRLAQQAADLIEDGFLEEAALPALAERLGVTTRHLRRVFAAEFGASPIAFAQTRRLLLAKRLLTDTDLDVTTIALAAGFGSTRRCNAAFQEHYRLTPTAIRKTHAKTVSYQLSFDLSYRPPYAWDDVLAFLDRRSIAGVEMVADGRYRRTVALPARTKAGAPGGLIKGWLEVAPVAGRPALRVTVSALLAPVIATVLARVKRLFDLACDPEAIAIQLGPLAAARPGLRVPGAFDGFEMAVRAILGQQVTVSAARTLAGRIAERYGEPLSTPFPELHRIFPSSATLASRLADDLAAGTGLGMPGQRVRALQALAEAHAAGQITLTPETDIAAEIATLETLPGIGGWTAQYIAMRALRWPDAFPHTDYGVRAALGKRPDREILALADRWRPFRAYAVLHLWHSLGDTPPAAKLPAA